MINKYDILKQYFGYSGFRTGQEILIDSILNGRDTLGIMPTGAGKSICFQVPALMMEGITLVISPLISLMKDQVRSLNQAGVNAAFLNSSLTVNQYYKALQYAREFRYKIIYVAPERLATEEFLDFAKNANISMVSVDESHCVSQWGQDFRPSYLRIPRFLDELPKRPVVSAFTATATKSVREDIIRLLELRDPTALTTGFDRKNLYFEVQKPKDKYQVIREYMIENPEKSGIIYCSTRKYVEEVCEKLISDGYAATRYHAGLSDKERKENQEEFLFDNKTVMVATNAFGMGIDKSNVSFVFHYNMPKNMESYYQEAGRAGRDGSPAVCTLLYHGQDVVTNQYMIDNFTDNDELDDETSRLVKEKDRERLKQMTYYCFTNDCLRDYILKYFGEYGSSYCGNCSNCLSNFEETDVTDIALKIVKGVADERERYGMKIIIDMLRGSKNAKILSYRLDRLPSYNSLGNIKEHKVREVFNFLTVEKYMMITNGEYPVVKVGNRGRELLHRGLECEDQELPLDIKIFMKVLKEEKEYIPRTPDEGTESTGKVYSRKKKTASAKGGGETNQKLFSELRTLRMNLAVKEKMPAYIVFSDAALRDMCEKQPVTDEQFLNVSGVGKTKLERYGREFIELIKEYVSKNGDS